MSYHVRIEELHNTSKSLIKQIDTWKEQLLNVRKSLVAIVHMEMGGEAAEALRAYVQEVHITALDWILGLLDTYRSSLILYVDGYRSIEPDIQGEISQKVLEDQLECLQREKADFLQTAENIEQIFRELNQYMDVDSVCLEDMEPCYDRAIQYAEQVRSQVGEYEETHRHDVDTIAEMMAYIEKFLRMHQLDGTKHILAYQPGSMAKLPEYQQAENLSALQRLYVEQVSDSVKEGLKHLTCGSAAEEEPASWCVLLVHGVVAAKGAASPYADGVLPHLTGKISDTIYLAAECVKSGAVSTDRLNAGVFRELNQLERQIQDRMGKVTDTYEYYEYSLQEVLEIQQQTGAVKLSKTATGGMKWVQATREEIETFLNPENSMDDVSKYQFIDLSSTAGVSQSEMGAFLEGKGILQGKEIIYLEAARKYNVRKVYLAAHSALETGNGTSALAQGIDVKGTTVYNMYGIGALDNDPEGTGALYAFEMGWDTPEKAIEGGAKWISENYINNSSNQQNTLYEMRWNPENPGTHQYATDIAWAFNQAPSIKQMYDNFPGAELHFRIPVYMAE